MEMTGRLDARMLRSAAMLDQEWRQAQEWLATSGTATVLDFFEKLRAGRFESRGLEERVAAVTLATLALHEAAYRRGLEERGLT